MSDFSKEGMYKHYLKLCAQRDATYAAKVELEAKLDEANARCEKARLEAAEIAKEIDEKYLTSGHFVLKKEIAFLARALSEKDGLLATKE